MIRHIAVSYMHLNLTGNALGTKRGSGKAGRHAEKQYAPVWLCKQNCGKFGTWNIDDIDRQVGKVFSPAKLISKAINQFERTCGISLYDSVSNVERSDIM